MKLILRPKGESAFEADPSSSSFPIIYQMKRQKVEIVNIEVEERE